VLKEDKSSTSIGNASKIESSSKVKVVKEDKSFASIGNVSKPKHFHKLRVVNQQDGTSTFKVDKHMMFVTSAKNPIVSVSRVHNYVQSNFLH